MDFYANFLDSPKIFLWKKADFWKMIKRKEKNQFFTHPRVKVV